MFVPTRPGADKASGPPRAYGRHSTSELIKRSARGQDFDSMADNHEQLGPREPQRERSIRSLRIALVIANPRDAFGSISEHALKSSLSASS